MLLGPVFNAEMVANGRRKRYFALRVLFASVLLMCLWLCYSEAIGYNNRTGRLSIEQAANLASSFFWTFAWLTMIAALVVTPAIAAGAIASERERRTIEYLFATDLSNAEIVLSKLAGKLLLVGKLVLVALPVLAIFRLLGGIPGNLLVMYFASLASTVTMLTVGAICISVWTPRARDAIIRVYLVEALVFVLPLFGLGLMGMGAGGTTGWLIGLLRYPVEYFSQINPLVLLTEQTTMNVRGMQVGSLRVWQAIGLQTATSLVLAILAVAAVRRVHLRSVSGGEKETRKTKWLSALRYRPALGEHPMLWKELFARSAATKLGFLGRMSIALLMIAMIAVAIGVYRSIRTTGPGSWDTQGEMYLMSTFIITPVWGVGIAILMGLRAAGLITYEKERDCWLSLISTPLTGQDIIGAKTLGNLYAFRWMFPPLAVVWLLQTTLTPEYFFAIVLHLLAIGISGLFATAVGLSYSLSLSTSLKSIGATMGTLFFVGGGYLFCCCLPMMFGSGDDEIIKIAMIPCVPFLQSVPSFFFFEDLISHEPWMVADYVLGLGAYSVASLVILSSLVTRFEHLAGRSDATASTAAGSFQPPKRFTPPNMDPAD
ncbi:ABC transporter permease [Aeoliella sp. ICT_H6.2]|uniref:ABC transporter permease n=1 Tax=Aeoliella straminimaris TaxID=2954799 RepID=A0A9X2FC82_9BACT|nr:ABC transporter permease [Aeoliella straminimaris]MCO6046280.1 ABC transporter permease [Aeoliella straminimaris]